MLHKAMPSPGLSVIDKNQSCYLIQLLFSFYALGMTFELLISYKHQGILALSRYSSPQRVASG